MRSRLLLASAVALAVAAGLALGGCGSSKLSSSGLRTRASVACRVGTARAGAIPTPTAPSGGAAFLQRAITVLGPELAQLRRLHPGDDDADDYATAVAAFGHELQLMRSSARGLAHGGDPVIAMGTLQRQLAPLEADGNAAWARLEIPACQAR